MKIQSDMLFVAEKNLIAWDNLIDLLKKKPDLEEFSLEVMGNTVRNVWKIVIKNPEWEKDMTKRLLRIQGNTHLYKGKSSSE